MRCPICSTEQEERESCINCGIIFSKFEDILKKKKEDNKVKKEDNKVKVEPVQHIYKTPPSKMVSTLESDKLSPYSLAQAKKGDSLKAQGDSPRAKEDLTDEEKLWTSVMEDYENRELHKKYIGYCLKNNMLSQSSRRYARLIQEKGQIPILLEFQQQVISVMQFTNLSPRFSRSKVKKEDSSKRALGCFAMGVSIFCIIVGTAFKSYGLRIFAFLKYTGFTLLFLSIGFHIYMIIRDFKKFKKDGIIE